MTFIVKTVTRLTMGFILIYGVYIAVSGHLSPGGGFAGGVIIALAFIHMTLAFGKDAVFKRLQPGMLRIIISMAGLAFLGMVMAPFPGLRAARCASEIAMPLCEAAIVGFGIFAIFISLVLLGKADRHS